MKMYIVTIGSISGEKKLVFKSAAHAWDTFYTQANATENELYAINPRFYRSMLDPDAIENYFERNGYATYSHGYTDLRIEQATYGETDPL